MAAYITGIGILIHQPCSTLQQGEDLLPDTADADAGIVSHVDVRVEQGDIAIGTNQQEVGEGLLEQQLAQGVVLV